MSNALTTMDDTTRELAARIKSVIGFQGSDSDLALFATVARRMNLDPFARQIYSVFRGGRMTIQTGIDGYRVIAFRAGLDAIGDPEFGPLKGGHPEWAKVSVWRKGSDRPTVGVAFWDEYAQTGGMWSKMPRTMIAKCAEAQALRKAFPEALSGVYTDDEMAQADPSTVSRQVEVIASSPDPEETSEAEMLRDQICDLMVALGKGEDKIVEAERKMAEMSVAQLRSGLAKLRSRAAESAERDDENVAA